MSDISHRSYSECDLIQVPSITFRCLIPIVHISLLSTIPCRDVLATWTRKGRIKCKLHHPVLHHRLRTICQLVHPKTQYSSNRQEVYTLSLNKHVEIQSRHSKLRMLTNTNVGKCVILQDSRVFNLARI